MSTTIDPGPGWRILREDELPIEGDEGMFLDAACRSWFATGATFCCPDSRKNSVVYRRRISAEGESVSKEIAERVNALLEEWDEANEKAAGTREKSGNSPSLREALRKVQLDLARVQGELDAVQKRLAEAMERRGEP